MNVSLKFLSVGFGQDAPIGLAGESSNQLKVKFFKIGYRYNRVSRNIVECNAVATVLGRVTAPIEAFACLVVSRWNGVEGMICC